MNDNIAKTATCTIYTFAENFSNSWTAVLFFRAHNTSHYRGAYRSKPRLRRRERRNVVHGIQDGLAN